MNSGGTIPRYLFVWLVSILLSIPAAAQLDSTPHYSSQQWDLGDGLPHVSVQSILPTHDGYLWVGTLKGVARFNADSFTTFDLTNAPALLGSRITALCESRDKTIWIGAHSGEVLRLQNGKISTLLPSLTLPAASAVLDIYEAHDGTIWIGTMQGAVRYKDGALLYFKKDELLGRSSVKKICEDSRNNLWIGTSSGLVRWNINTAVLMNSAEGYPTDFVRAVCSDADGGVWFGTSSMLGHIKNGLLTQYTKKDGLADVNITTLYRDRRGTLWIGTYGGLIQRRGETFSVEFNAARDPYDQVYALAEDTEENIWVGAKDGLYRLKQKQFSSYTSQQGLAHNNVTCVRQNRDGAMWFGTWGGGLHRLTDGKLEIFNLNTGTAFGNDMNLSLCETRDGTLWVGNDFDGGLFRFKGGQVTQVGKEDFNNRAVRVLYEDSKSTLWIGTSTGLSLYRDGAFKHFTTQDGLPTPRIRAITEDRTGRLWIGTEKGLVLQNNKGQFTRPGNLNGLATATVVAIFPDSKGALWFGTLGAGLYRLDGEQLYHYTAQQGLPSDDIYEILEDDENNFWFSCLKGVFFISKEQFATAHDSSATLSMILYDKDDGMVSSQCNGSSKPAAWKSKDGRLWFATSKGLSVITPGALLSKAADAPPRVFIEKVASGKREFLADPISKSTSLLEIEPGHSELEFRFAALSFRAPEKNRFRYKLDGFDTDWIDANSSRNVVYKSIRPGKYRFQVIAANSDGVWNREGASLGFVLLPHFWQTWWFIALSIGFGLVGLGAIVRNMTAKNLQWKLESLERQNAVQRERTRIAQDMHDDIGARLTEILFLSDVVSDEKRKHEETRGHVKRISTAARELVRNLDVIVWALNPKNDTLDSFALYVYEYVETFLGPTGIRCRLDVPDELPTSALTSEIRHNLFLVIKEALNNVAKHSCASEVWFRLSLSKTLLSIAIEDDGKGFVREKSNSLGNGLTNMEKRMESIGGCFDLQTDRTLGTKIRLQITIRKG